MKRHGWLAVSRGRSGDVDVIGAHDWTRFTVHHDGGVDEFSFTPDSLWLVTGSVNGDANLISLAKRSWRQILPGCRSST